MPDVAERVDLYREHADAGQGADPRCATVHGNLVVLDLRDEEVIHPTNRFTIYALFPQCNISIHVLWGLQAAEHGVRDGQVDPRPLERTNVGELMLAYGGGGHDAAGTCQVENADAPRVLGELIERIRRSDADGRGRAAPDAHLSRRTRSSARLIERLRRAAPARARLARGGRRTSTARCVRSITGQQLSVKAARGDLRAAARALRRPAADARGDARRRPRGAARRRRALAREGRATCARWPSTCSPASWSSTGCASSPTARSIARAHRRQGDRRVDARTCS